MQESLPTAPLVSEPVVQVEPPVIVNDEKPKTNEIQLRHNFLVVLLSVLLFISVLIAGFFAYQTQSLVKELTLMKTEPTPTYEAIVEPVVTTDPIADWKEYKYRDLFEIKVPQALKISDNGYGRVEIGDFLAVGTYTSNPEDCRGDCSIITTKESKIVNSLNTRYLIGWWGEIGGNVAQSYISYIIPSDNQYIYLQMQELPFSVLTTPARNVVGPVSLENTMLLDQILSTFKFTN